MSKKLQIFRWTMNKAYFYRWFGIRIADSNQHCIIALLANYANTEDERYFEIAYSTTTLNFLGISYWTVIKARHF